MSPSLCSVVIPSYNRRDSLQRVLEALGRQTADMRSVEVVVVLDGSTDGSEELLRTWQQQARLPNLRWIRQANAGQSAARTAGAREAKAPVLLFLDDDIAPDPGLVAAHLRWHADGSSVAVFGDSHIVRTGRDTLYQMIVWAWWEDMFHERRRAGRPASYRDFCAGNVSLRAEDFARAGGFDPAFKGYGGEDYDLGYRLQTLGVRFIADSDATALHYHTASPVQVLRNMRQEGYNDVLLGAKHPELRRGLRLITRVQNAKRVFKAPRACAAGAWALTGLLRGYELLGLQGGWRRLFGKLRHYSYWCGVRDALGDWKSLVEYQSTVPPIPRFELDLDDRGLPAELPKIWTDGPSELVVRYCGRPLGRVILQGPIQEPLAAYLANQLIGQLESPLRAAVPGLPARTSARPRANRPARAADVKNRTPGARTPQTWRRP